MNKGVHGSAATRTGFGYRMNIKSIPALLGILTVFFISPSAHALDQLPLPEAGVSPVQAEVTEFASLDDHKSSPDICGKILIQPAYNAQKIKAIKAYRQCRAEHALQQLAVWRWQDHKQN